jgi:hypothetical protein
MPAIDNLCKARSTKPNDERVKANKITTTEKIVRKRKGKCPIRRP